jgi:hypothetical protein
VANRKVDYNFVVPARTSIIEPETLTDLTRLDADDSIFVGVVGSVAPKYTCANRALLERETSQCLSHDEGKKILATLS